MSPKHEYNQIWNHVSCIMLVTSDNTDDYSLHVSKFYWAIHETWNQTVNQITRCVIC